MKATAERFRFLVKPAKAAIVISAMCAALFSVLLVTNYIQLELNNPLDTPALVKLIGRLDANKADQELKTQIRELDLVARKAFFTKQWQIQFAGIVLFASVIVLLASLKFTGYFNKTSQVKKPREDVGATESRQRTAVIILLVFLFSTSIVIGFFSYLLLDEKSMDEKLAKIGEVQKESKARTGTNDSDMLANWPSFRGAFGTGRTVNEKNYFTKERIDRLSVLWKARVNKNGFNSPILWNDRIFFTGGDDKGVEIYCVARADGATMWSRELEKILGRASVSPSDIETGAGYAAPTMATDGTRVFAIFASGDLVSLDFDGNTLWKKDFGTPDNTYGHASSPVSYGNILLVQFDNLTESKLYALDTATGESIWEKKRDVLASWSTPSIVQTEKYVEILTNGNPNAIAYRLDNGDMLWSVECMTGDVATSPAYAKGTVFVANQYARLAAIDNSTGTIAWETYDDLPAVASPVANEDYVFIATDYGVLSCFDSKNGTSYWTHEFENGFYSSPVLAGETLVLIDMKGTLYFIKTDSTFLEIGKLDLGEKIVSTPALKDGKIYVRGESNLFCLGIRD